MVSTDEAHHRVNSGMSLADYWKMTERCTAMAHEAGMKMCGTVSTIWGSPMEGTRVTDLSSAVEFSKIYLDLGADYIEQADHDGSADPQRVYEYFTMILDPDITGEVVLIPSTTWPTSTPPGVWGWLTTWRPCRRESPSSRAPWARWAASRPT